MCKINGKIYTATEMKEKGLKCCMNCTKCFKCSESSKSSALKEHCKKHRFRTYY